MKTQVESLIRFDNETEFEWFELLRAMCLESKTEIELEQKRSEFLNLHYGKSNFKKYFLTGFGGNHFWVNSIHSGKRVLFVDFTNQ